jgi:spermidine/putrescine transport system permease protein
LSETVDRAALSEAAGSLRPPARRGERALARRKRGVAYGLLTPGAFYLLLAFILPLIFIIYTSLKSGGLLSGGYSFTWEFSNYTEGFTTYRTQFVRSIIYAGVATGICLLLAYPMAYWIAFYAGRWKSTLFLLILVPFFVTFVIRTVMWKFILADDGVVLSFMKDVGVLADDYHVLGTQTAVIAGLAYNYIAFTALPLYVSLERIDKRLVEAAKDLYATRSEAFRKVVLPLSYPGVFAAIILTFVPMTGDYINSQLLGNPDTTMIGQIIQSKFLGERDYPAAAALSVMLMIGMLVIALIYARALGTEDESLSAGAA